MYRIYRGQNLSSNSGAFAVLLALIGTVSMTKFKVAGSMVWREVRGPMRAFGHVRGGSELPGADRAPVDGTSS